MIHPLLRGESQFSRTYRHVVVFALKSAEYKQDFAKQDLRENKNVESHCQRNKYSQIWPLWTTPKKILTFFEKKSPALRPWAC